MLLRQLAQRRLPPALATLPKRGFTVPIGEWIGDTYRDVFRDEVLGTGSRVSSLLDGREVARLLDRHVSGAEPNGHALWAIWLLERWLRRVVITQSQRVDALSRTTVGR